MFFSCRDCTVKRIFVILTCRQDKHIIGSIPNYNNIINTSYVSSEVIDEYIDYLMRTSVVKKIVRFLSLLLHLE